MNSGEKIRRTCARLVSVLGPLAIVLATVALRPHVAIGGEQTDQARIEELSKQVAPLEELFALVEHKVRPSVVHVATRIIVRTPRERGPVPETPFERFFGDDFFKFFDLPRELPRQGLGSGVIVDERGYVLTNNHVAKGADKIEVKLSDGREFDAQVVGGDEASDLAVLKIDPGTTKLQAAALGDSETVKVGQWVLAIGSPFGLDNTLTSGIISATARAGMGLAKYENFLQTDAAINPGNSGGPLVSLRGEVIGINTAIVTGSGSFAGVGFAIPSNMARKIMTDLIDKGRVVRGWLGVVIQEITPALAEQFGLGSTEGALVAQVLPGSPAEKAGIQRGDVIVQFGEQNVKTHAELMQIVAATSVGQKVKVKVIRDRKPLELDIEVAERTEEAVAAAEGGGNSARQLGLTLQTLTPELAAQLGYEGEKGVVVTGVDPDGPAADKGIDKGDLILEVNKHKVESVQDYERVLKDTDLSEGVLHWVRKQSGASVFVVISTKKAP